jgi:cytochrome c oxidase subunit 2
MLDFILKEASSYARDIDQVIVIVAVLGGFWLILAEALFFYFIWKFHRSRSPKAQYITGEQKHEKKWIHLPHNLVLLCDVAIIIVAVRVWYNVKQDLPPADETIRIVAQQWAWRFTDPGPDGQLDTADDVETVDELHVKVNKTYHFKLESADVMHSFSVPVFRLKQDAIPGREITGWFKPTVTGEFDIQCAEICGIGHALMPARIHIETDAEHDAWLASKKTTTNG